MLHKSNLNPFSYWKIGHYHRYTNKLVWLFTVLPFWSTTKMDSFFPSKYFANMFFVLLIWMNIFIFSWIFSHRIWLSGCLFYTVNTCINQSVTMLCRTDTVTFVSTTIASSLYVSLSSKDWQTRNPPVHPEPTVLRNTFSYLPLSLEDESLFPPLWSVLSTVFSPSICFLVFLMQIHVAAGLKSFDWNILHPNTQRCCLFYTHIV